MTHALPAAEQQVVRAIETMTQAFHAGNLAEVLAAYRPGAVVAFEPGLPTSGEAALAEGFEGFFQVSPRFTYSGHDALVAGDVALHIAPWDMTGTAPDGTPIRQRGLSVAVLVRSLDGTWKMAIDNPHGDRLLGRPTIAG